MKKPANKLGTAARDVRVTRKKPLGHRLTARCVGIRTFAVNMIHRWRRFPRAFTAIETTLRHIVPHVMIQPLYQQNRVELAPRLTLAVRPERRIETLERQIQTRLLWKPGPRADKPASSPAERIVRLLAAYAERQRGLRPSERHSMHTVPEMQHVATRVGENDSGGGLDNIPSYRQPVALAMVVRRPQSPSPAIMDESAAPVSAAPGLPERRSLPSSIPTMPPLDGSYLRRLTDSVMEALDRRTTAAYERTRRRSV